MTKANSPKPEAPKPDTLEQNVGSWLVRSLILLAIVLIIGHLQGKRPEFLTFEGSGRGADAPLVKQGGDPYVRALMRTISASESNVRNPYGVMYGGTYAQSLNEHPDRCITIVNGPNIGNCTTAAGRYQFITTTWQEKARRYHPAPDGFFMWQNYSFEPQYQDEVVYRWLSDSQAWGVDIPQLLRKGQVDRVLKILSPTWTSLGYGIETNSMSDALPRIYQRVLQQELKQGKQSSF
ncbi:glycoside hydrolase family protein [Leptolyngbya sp. FACHB-17]|uniref:glycoside hydrolase family 24 protein n=1 Tax=unclassified Leptolyngbya TaxID=2650499 RepID=UPI0016810610|nr:glycoside hydrolase family protein [Leptolyngbya sp. FACHB-17]MBD2080970.1 glycoside hydrolase family protein [Leptolyngbya sp. FACHB-17]